MTQPPEIAIVESRPPTDEQQRMVALFDEIERGQLTLLDEAGKRIIELTTALLGVVFAALALGETFPPPHLTTPPVKILAVLTLVLYVGAMLLGMRTVQPRSYQRYHQNLQGMRAELDSIIATKSRWLWWAGLLFWLGSLALAGLIGWIVVIA